MATIINTLEVVIEPPKQAAAPFAPDQAPPAMLSPRDLDDIAERRARHGARLLAH